MDSLDVRIFIIFAVRAYSSLLFLYVILTFLQSMAGMRLPDVLRPAANFIYDVCEPFLRLFRGLLPGVSLGGMGLDLSPIIAFLVLFIVTAILQSVLL